MDDITKMAGLKERSLADLGPCAVCGRKALEGEDGRPTDLTFYRLTLSRAAWLPDAIRRRVGLGMQIGDTLAQVMGPNDDLAKVFAGPVDVFVHERCASKVVHLLELFPKEEEDDGTQSRG